MSVFYILQAQEQLHKYKEELAKKQRLIEQLTMYVINADFFILPTQCYASTLFVVIACLSVYLSVTSQSCTKMAKCRIMETVHMIAQGL